MDIEAQGASMSDGLGAAISHAAFQEYNRLPLRELKYLRLQVIHLSNIRKQSGQVSTNKGVQI